MSPITGRPLSNNPRKNNTRIRMTDEEVEILELCCEKTGLSKAEVIRLGIQKVYEEITKK